MNILELNLELFEELQLDKKVEVLCDFYLEGALKEDTDIINQAVKMREILIKQINDMESFIGELNVHIGSLYKQIYELGGENERI